MTTEINPTTPSVDIDCLSVQDLTEKERFALYRNELAKAGTIKSILIMALSYERKKAENILNTKISEVLDNLEEVTECRIEGMTVEVTQELSMSDPGEKEYRAKVTLTMDNPEF